MELAVEERESNGNLLQQSPLQTRLLLKTLLKIPSTPNICEAKHEEHFPSDHSDLLPPLIARHQKETPKATRKKTSVAKTEKTKSSNLAFKRSCHTESTRISGRNLRCSLTWISSGNTEMPTIHPIHTKKEENKHRPSESSPTIWSATSPTRILKREGKKGRRSQEARGEQ